MIKRVGERFEVHICRVHVLVKFLARIIGDITRGNGYRFDSVFVTRIGDINRVLSENYRIVVSERDRATAESFRFQRDPLWRRGIGELVPLARFGDVPVLAKATTEIASRGAKREHTRSRQKMVQRFFLNRIDTKSAASSVGSQHDSIAHALPHKTKTALSFVQFAKPWT